MIANNARARTFSVEGLPRVPADLARATRLLGRVRAGLPRAPSVDVPGIGAITLEPESIACGSLGLETLRGGESFAVVVNGHAGRLVLDARLALKLVHAHLGLASPRLVRPLRPFERGILVAVIAAALDALHPSHVTTIGFAAGAAPPDALSIRLRVHALGGLDLAHVELSLSALPTALGSRVSDDFAAVPLRAPLVVARTDLSRAEVASLGVGDAVIFGRMFSLDEDSWPGEVALGRVRVPVAIDAHGRIRATDNGLHTNDDRKEDLDMSTDTKTEPDIVTAEPGAPIGDDMAAVLAGVPVEVVAELARVTLRGDELAGLMKGGVVTLGKRRPKQVELRVGDKPIAVGELVMVDDDLGVRITELV